MTRGLAVAAVLCAAAFTALTVAVAAHPVPFAVDRAAVRFVEGLQTGWVTAALRTASAVGSAPGIAVTIAIVATGILLARRDPAPGAWLLAEYAGAVVLYQGLKALVDRTRPPGGLVEASGAAFPSGHATQGVAFFGLLAVVFLAVLPPRARAWAAGAAVVMGSLSGLSRVYLEVHWLTDVVGGFLLGGAWLATLLLLRGAARIRPRDPPGPDPSSPGP